MDHDAIFRKYEYLFLPGTYIIEEIKNEISMYFIIKEQNI